LTPEEAGPEHRVIALARLRAAIADEAADEGAIDAVDAVLRPDLDRAPRLAEEARGAALGDLFELQIGRRSRRGRERNRRPMLPLGALFARGRRWARHHHIGACDGGSIAALGLPGPLPRAHR